MTGVQTCALPISEFGLVAETGREGLAQLAGIITDESNREALPSAMKQALQAIIDQLAALELQTGLWNAPRSFEWTPISQRRCPFR